MTTITVEIDDEKDVSALKNYLTESGYRFEVDDDLNSEYSKDFKAILDQRHNDYLTGKMPAVSAEESKIRINRLLNNR